MVPKTETFGSSGSASLFLAEKKRSKTYDAIMCCIFRWCASTNGGYVSVMAHTRSSLEYITKGWRNNLLQCTVLMQVCTLSDPPRCCRDAIMPLVSTVARWPKMRQNNSNGAVKYLLLGKKVANFVLLFLTFSCCFKSSFDKNDYFKPENLVKFKIFLPKPPLKCSNMKVQNCWGFLAVFLSRFIWEPMMRTWQQWRWWWNVPKKVPATGEREGFEAARGGGGVTNPTFPVYIAPISWRHGMYPSNLSDVIYSGSYTVKKLSLKQSKVMSD